jgi:hypothetical protein
MARNYSWESQVRALHVVHGYGLASDLGALEAAQARLVADGELEAAAVVAEWYAVAGARQLELEAAQELERVAELEGVQQCRCDRCRLIHGRAA